MSSHRFLAPACLAALAACATPPREPDEASAEDLEPGGSAGLRAYKEAYYRSLGRRFVDHVTEPQLAARLRSARVLYLGDHHDDDDLHRHMLEILDLAHRAGLELVLGLEAVGEQDQSAVDDYLAGRLDMDGLREQVGRRWSSSWLDSEQVDASFYRELLERARAFAMPVFALEPAPRWDLWRRDAIIADNVLDAARRHPGALLVVLVGQAHLLGEERVIARVGLPWVALGARPSVALRAQLATYPAPADARYLVTESGVLLRRFAAVPDEGL